MTDAHPHDIEEDLYREIILDHYREPRNVGRIEDAAIRRKEMNSSCGDAVEMFVALAKDGTVAKATFVGRGCALSQASASLLTEKLKGMPLDAVRRLSQDDILKLLGVQVGTTRIRCALLPLKTLMQAIADRDASTV